MSTALLSALFTLSVSVTAIAERTPPSPPTKGQTAMAKACGADTTRQPTKSFARGLTGPWQPVSDRQLESETWGQTASIWQRQNNAGIFVELRMLDDPEAGDWAQVIDYCFGANGKITWIHSRYNSFDQQSRIVHLEFNEEGTVTSHSERCAALDSDATRPADEGCQDSNAFPIVKRLENFPFLAKEIVKIGHRKEIHS